MRQIKSSSRCVAALTTKYLDYLPTLKKESYGYGEKKGENWIFSEIKRLLEYNLNISNAFHKS